MKYFNATTNAAVSNTTAATSLVPMGAGSLSVPAFILSGGRELEIFASGVYSCTALGPTVTTTIKLGSMIIAQAVITTVLSVATNLYWQARLKVVCRGVNTGNTSCSLLALGMVQFVSAAGTLAVATLANPSGAMSLSIVDNSADLALSVTDTWSTASTANSVTVGVLGLDIK